MLDPKVLLMFATGTLLLLNGLIARVEAAKRPAPSELSDEGASEANAWPAPPAQKEG